MISDQSIQDQIQLIVDKGEAKTNKLSSELEEVKEKLEGLTEMVLGIQQNIMGIHRTLATNKASIEELFDFKSKQNHSNNYFKCTLG
jgi:hypothetical protein